MERAPIEDGRAAGAHFDRQFAGGRPVEDAKGELARTDAERVEIHQRAANRTAPE